MLKKILKGVLFGLLALTGLVAAWVLFNRFDARRDPAREFSAADLIKDDFSAANGYYLLWALGETPEVDITSAAVRNKYRALFDPEMGAKWRSLNHETYKEMYRRNFYHTRIKLGKKHGLYPVSEAPDRVTVDWMSWVLKHEAYLREIGVAWEVLLRRYNKLQAAPVIQEFMAPTWDAPIPNLLAWLHVAKVFDSLCLLRAHDGDWSGAAGRLLDHLAFSRRAMAGSRAMITRLIGIAVYRLNCQALASLLNQPECPAGVCEMISDRLPGLSPAGIDSRQSIVGEYLAVADALQNGKDVSGQNLKIGWLARLLLQKNRTLRIWHDWGERFLELERTPPYHWPKEAEESQADRLAGFWWLQNPTGKRMGQNYHVPLLATLYKVWKIRTLYDLLRISAELHLRYDFSRPVAEVLPTLASYRAVDPGSGKSYIWNDSKQILYGVGLDRVDDGGRESIPEKVEGQDYVLPCVLYVRPGAK